MDKILTTDVYLPVDKENPEMFECVVSYREDFNAIPVKKFTGMIVLTVEQFDEIRKTIAGDAFDAGQHFQNNLFNFYASGDKITESNKTEYIANLLK